MANSRRRAARGGCLGCVRSTLPDVCSTAGTAVSRAPTTHLTRSPSFTRVRVASCRTLACAGLTQYVGLYEPDLYKYHAMFVNKARELSSRLMADHQEGPMNAPPCIVYVWRGEGSAPARTGQGLVIASEAIARSFGVFGSLLDEFDGAFIALPCPAEEDDVKRMVDLIVAFRASSGVECPICYEALGDNSLKTGCCNQPMHSSCLYRALARTPTCPMCRQAGAERAAHEPRGPSPLPVDADHFLRFYTAAHQLDCSYIVDICAKHLADRFSGKTVEKLVDEFGACDEADVLCDDLGRLAVHAMPHSAAVTLCEKFRASRRTCRAMSWRTAARLLDEDLRGELDFQLVSPIRADAVFAARALVGERGAHAAEALHRALEEFAHGGIVRDAEDLPACIELRALAD